MQPFARFAIAHRRAVIAAWVVRVLGDCRAPRWVVIRTILLPAVLELVGRRTWTIPRSLDRLLPQLTIEPAGTELAEVVDISNPLPTTEAMS